jgi:hypothetical protein
VGYGIALPPPPTTHHLPPHLRRWRNSRRASLRSWCPQGCEGANPSRRTTTGFSSTSRASACQVEGRGCEPRNPDHWDCSSFRRAPALQAGGGEGRARQFHHPLPSSISQDACLSNRKGRGSTGWEYHSTAQVLRAAHVARTYGGAGQNCGAVPAWGQGQEGRHSAGSAEGRERYPVAPPL